MINKVFAIVVLFVAFNLSASVEQPYVLKSLEFVGKDGFYINIKRSPMNSQISV